MLTIQQLIKALRKLQNSNTTAKTAVDLAKHLKNATSTTAPTTAQQAIVTSVLTTTSITQESKNNFGALLTTPNQQNGEKQQLSNETNATTKATHSSQNLSHTKHSAVALSNILQSNVYDQSVNATLEHLKSNVSSSNNLSTQQQQPLSSSATQEFSFHRNQQIQKFYQQQLLHFHTQQNCNLQAKQQQTQFAMSSLAAAMEPVALKQQQQDDAASSAATAATKNDGVDDSSHGSSSKGIGCQDDKFKDGAAPCFSTGFGEILKFMELIGNLKHTKRTGWVLRDVNDCESISGHMYRMSMMTFLLDGSEGLNQIRCMELALVHDLAESLVGDITPFCGVSKAEKRAMEFKAMDDICKLIEPRGKRIMELFEEYEHGESAESKFVKDLDRLDMVMQAFEYEKRDNCLLKHQEFFDSTAGKFNHPFVKKLVDEICAQRSTLAQVKGATPPPSVQVPDMDSEELPASTQNGHSEPMTHQGKQQTNSNSS